MTSPLYVPLWKRCLILLYSSTLLFLYFRVFQDELNHYDFWFLPVSVEVWISSIMSMVVSGIVYGFIVGYSNRTKGGLYGFLTSGIYWGLILGVVVWAYFMYPDNREAYLEAFNTVELKYIMPILTVVSFISTSIAGYYGSKYAQSHELNSETNIAEFYFAPHWQLFFSCLFAGTLATLLITALDDLWLLFLWATVGSLFILIHPSLWFFGYFGDLITFSLTWTGTILCFYGPVFLMDVCKNQKKKWKRYLFVFLLYFVIYWGISICLAIGKGPMSDSIYMTSVKGIKVWDFLVPRDDRPMEYINLMRFYREKEDYDEEKKYRDKLYESADDYVRRYMAVGREMMALNMIDGLLELEENDVMLMLIKSDIYDHMGEYDKDYELLSSIREANKALRTDMDDEVAIELMERLNSYEAELSEDEELPASEDL